MATKKTSTKKSTTKKAPARKAALRKGSAKSSSSRMIALTPESGEFMTFRLTRQTVYWMVLGTVVVLFSIWILRLQSDVQSIYDKIEATQADAESTYVDPATGSKKN